MSKRSNTRIRYTPKGYSKVSHKSVPRIPTSLPPLVYPRTLPPSLTVFFQNVYQLIVWSDRIFTGFVFISTILFWVLLSLWKQSVLSLISFVLLLLIFFNYLYALILKRLLGFHHVRLNLFGQTSVPSNSSHSSQGSPGLPRSPKSGQHIHSNRNDSLQKKSSKEKFTFEATHTAAVYINSMIEILEYILEISYSVMEGRNHVVTWLVIGGLFLIHIIGQYINGLDFCVMIILFSLIIPKFYLCNKIYIDQFLKPCYYACRQIQRLIDQLLYKSKVHKM